MVTLLYTFHDRSLITHLKDRNWLSQSVMEKPHVKRILLEEHFFNSIREHGLQLSLCSFHQSE